LLFLQTNNVQAQNKSCACDTVKTKAKVSNKNFSALPQFDKLSFSKKNFENLDQANKKVLWYRELDVPILQNLHVCGMTMTIFQ
jgi:hypothetical protein